MDLKKLKEIKNFFILIVPEGRGVFAKQRKLSSGSIFIVLITYTIIIALFGFLFFNLTPLKSLIFPVTSLTSQEIEQISQLNERVVFLAKELEGLKSTNERLKYAILLGDTALIDSFLRQSPSKQDIDTSGKKGGSILKVFRDFVKRFSSSVDFLDNHIFLLRPVSGYVSREFNPEKGHFGVDFVVKTGTPIISAANGYVVFSGYTTKDGYMIIIAHPDDIITIYKHCSLLLKNKRDKVLQGELIALSGNTGEITTGPHLHFEVWKNGNPLDPKSVIINY